MLFTDLAVVLFNRDGHQIQWRWEPQETDPGTVEFELLRAEGPDGPYDTIATLDPETDFSFFDKTAPFRIQNQVIYYRVRVVLRATGAEVGLSPAFGTQSGPLPQDALLIIEQQNIMLEGVNGHVPTKGIPGGVTIYRKRNFGRACTECRDAVTGRIVVSDCRTCHGTGKLDGFYSPVNVGMNISPYAANIRRLNLQKVEDCETVGVMNNYPVVFPGDILVEPNEKHWQVNRVDVRERHRILVRQILYLSQLKPDDIAHETLRHVSHGGKKF